MTDRLRTLAARALLAGALVLVAPPAPAGPSRLASPWPEAPAAGPADTAFAALVARLSEPGGDFDSDNLLSNEASYLHVLGALRARGVSGGAYVGVGPEQNFAYIAAIRPRIAYVVDIRRDNLLEQLLFKAIFARSRTRLEYLCLLTGRAPPADLERWRERPVERLVQWVDAQPPSAEVADAAVRAVLAEVRSTGVPLSGTELATVERFHRAFIDAGLDLRYTSRGRPPRGYYPTYRQLLLERDLDGHPGSHLAREEDFQFLKGMQARGLVVPVVGDLAGPHAVAAIAADMRARGDSLAAFYTSNVEQYLMRDGGFDRWVAKLARLPHTAGSVVIRSYFGRNWMRPHPNAVAGYPSVQLLQPVRTLVAAHAMGEIVDYWELVTVGVVKP